MDDKLVITPTKAGKYIVQYPATEETLERVGGRKRLQSYGNAFQDCDFLVVQVPYPRALLRKLDRAIRVYEDTPIKEHIVEALSSRGKLIEVLAETGVFVEVMVIVPIPYAIAEDRKYNLLDEIIPEVDEALVMQLRVAQVALMEGISVHYGD